MGTIYITYYLYLQRIVDAKTTSPVPRGLSGDTPRISVIVPTYNEESTIEGKLHDLIGQEYPLDKMEVIVIDSGSIDQTPRIVQSFIDSHPALNLVLMRESERRGKSAAMNKAIQSVSPKSEIVVVTDSDSRLGERGLTRVVEALKDPRVGLVTGMQLVANPRESDSTRLESSYRSFYSVIREGESLLDSTPICDGELVASKRSVLQSFRVREDVNADDTQLAILTRRAGFRSICCPEATFQEFAPPKIRDLWKQKVRRGQGIVRTLWANRDLLFNSEYGKFGTLIFPMNFYMHLVSPVVLVGLAILSVGMLTAQWGLLGLGAMTTVALVFVGLAPRTKVGSTIVTFAYYQLILFAAIVMSVRGKSLHKWEKITSVRSDERWTALDSQTKSQAANERDSPKNGCRRCNEGSINLATRKG
jgi:cellulose synthase/poly-beta-1,6-N-acetylglucosamine synthase-like glycosyltransferase